MSIKETIEAVKASDAEDLLVTTWSDDSDCYSGFIGTGADLKALVSELEKTQAALKAAMECVEHYADGEMWELYDGGQHIRDWYIGESVEVNGYDKAQSTQETVKEILGK